MTPREKLKTFIEKNYAKEREKMMDGNKHQFYGWEDIKNEYEVQHSKNTEVTELNTNYQLAIEYLKQAGLYSDFETWKRAKKMTYPDKIRLDEKIEFFPELTRILGYFYGSNDTDRLTLETEDFGEDITPRKIIDRFCGNGWYQRIYLDFESLLDGVIYKYDEVEKPIYLWAKTRGYA